MKTKMQNGGDFRFSDHQVIAVVNEALSAPSFFSFVSYLNGIGLEFTLRGKNPRLAHANRAFRLRTLGLLPSLSNAFQRWESTVVTFDYNDRQVWALRLRLYWMNLSRHTRDIPAGMDAICLMAGSVGEDEVAHAIASVFRTPEITDNFQRWVEVCKVCDRLPPRIPTQMVRPIYWSSAPSIDGFQRVPFAVPALPPVPATLPQSFVQARAS